VHLFFICFSTHKETNNYKNHRDPYYCKLQYLSSVYTLYIHTLSNNYYCRTAGGKLLLELNRVLRPGGFFVWSATPIYQKLPEDVEIWNGKLDLRLTFLCTFRYFNPDMLLTYLQP